MHPREEKDELRQSIEQRLARLKEGEREAEGRTLCRELLPHIPADAVVCAYVPLSTEADIRPLLREMFARGQHVYLPVFQNKLIFKKAIDLETLKKGALGIMEPPTDAEELNRMHCDIVLVPGRAFDPAGGRLGRGNGGYDVWIEQQRKTNPKTMFIGVGLECQIVNAVPMEAHDQRMDMIASARGVQTRVES